MPTSQDRIAELEESSLLISEEVANNGAPYSHDIISSIRSHLAEVLYCPKLRSSPQLQKFLKFIVEETLAGCSFKIKQSTIATKALNRPPPFDPKIDPIVRIQARRLRRLLSEYYTQNTDAAIRIEIPRGSYVPIFHTTPIKNQLELSTNIPINQREFSESIKVWPELLSVPAGPSLLLIPFSLPSILSDKDYIADGLLEWLVSILSRYENLQVIGPLSRLWLDESNFDLWSIGKSYGAHLVLYGSLNPGSESSFVVSARLIEIETQRLLWSEIYDVSYHDANLVKVYAAQQDIASRIAATIADSYGVIPRTWNPVVDQVLFEEGKIYEATLRYYHHFTVLTEASLAAALSTLEEAVNLEPNYALTQAMLADLYWGQYHILGGDSELLERHDCLVKRATVLNPYCQLAQMMKQNTFFYRRQTDLFLEQVERTLRLNPNHATTLAGSGTFVAIVGKWEQGLAMVKKAIQLNPHYPGWYHLAPFLNYCHQGKFQEALLEAARFDMPNFYFDPLLRSVALGYLGRTEESVSPLTDMRSLLPDLDLRDLLLRTFYSDQNVDVLLEGLRRAGWPL